MQQNSIVSEPQKKPIITVITICLNMEAEIENTIRSVLQQEDADFEYIIKDGNSSDNTNNIIRKLIKEYGKENVKHIISEDTGNESSSVIKQWRVDNLHQRRRPFF